MIRALTFALCCSALSAQVQTCPKGEYVLMDGHCSEVWGCGGCLDHDNIKFPPLTLTWISPLAAPQETNVYGSKPPTAVRAPSYGVPMPNPQQTPGKANPALTKAILCSPSFRTGPYRHVSVAEKLAVCRAYGIFKGCPGRGYEIDHLIPLELGGSDSILNLWPQPSGPGGYHAKDVIENRAHKAVCAGSIGLRDAQQSISHDWYTFGLSLQ